MPNRNTLIQGSSLLSPAYGRVGQGRHFFYSVPPPSEKIAGDFQQAGKKEGGLGEGIFARLPKRSPAALRRDGWKLISKSPLICSQNCPPKRGAKPRARRLIQYGGPTGTRTPNPLIANEMLYQLSHRPSYGCGYAWTRTRDLVIISDAL